MSLKGGLIYHLTCLLYAPYLGKLYDLKNHELQISVMVSIAVSKMGMTELIFVVPGMRKSTASITAMFYSLSRCYQRSSMLQAIRLSFNKTTLRLIVQGPH